MPECFSGLFADQKALNDITVQYCCHFFLSLVKYFVLVLVGGVTSQYYIPS